MSNLRPVSEATERAVLASYFSARDMPLSAPAGLYPASKLLAPAGNRLPAGRFAAVAPILALKPLEAVKVYGYSLDGILAKAALRNPDAIFEATKTGRATWVVERVA